MSRIRTGIWAGLLLALAPLPALADAAGCSAQPIASLPMTLVLGKPLVFIQINGQAATFAIDTGGFASAVSEKLVERLKLPTFPIRSFQKLTDIGGARNSKYAKVDSIQLGALKGGAEQFMVGDFGPGIDGLIAPDYLRNFDLDLDFAGGKLNLYRPQSCTGHPPGSGEFSAVEMDVTSQGHIRIPVTLDGKRLWATIDTGAGGTLITSAEARSSFDIRMSGKGGKVGGTAGGTLNAEAHDFKTLDIAAFTQDHPTLAVVDAKDSFEHSPLLLGIANMRQLRLLVAYRERRLYVSQPPMSMPPAMTAPAPVPPRPVLTAADAIARARAVNAEPARFHFTIRSIGQSGGTLYLDSEADYRNAANIAVDVPEAMFPDLRRRFGDDFRTSMVGKEITVAGVPTRRMIRTRDADGKDGAYFQTHIMLEAFDRLSAAP